MVNYLELLIGKIVTKTWGDSPKSPRGAVLPMSSCK